MVVRCPSRTVACMAVLWMGAGNLAAANANDPCPYNSYVSYGGSFPVGLVTTTYQVTPNGETVNLHRKEATLYTASNSCNNCNGTTTCSPQEVSRTDAYDVSWELSGEAEIKVGKVGVTLGGTFANSQHHEVQVKFSVNASAPPGFIQSYAWASDVGWVERHEHIKNYKCTPITVFDIWGANPPYWASITGAPFPASAAPTWDPPSDGNDLRQGANPLVKCGSQ